MYTRNCAFTWLYDILSCAVVAVSVFQSGTSNLVRPQTAGSTEASLEILQFKWGHGPQRRKKVAFKTALTQDGNGEVTNFINWKLTNSIKKQDQPQRM